MGSSKVKTVGKYHVLDVLGKGGMGVVYKATDPAIGRLVAIKMITGGHYDDSEFLKRFYREAQSTGKLQHRNIVIVHDLGDEEGAPYLVMEYLEGESLQSVINEKRPLPLLDKLSYVAQACDGLHYAHQRDIIHRDIKPANLMVIRDGTVKIVDFGVARIGSESVTRTGQVIGTIQYMSPEQINGTEIDRRTDIFSLGVVMYELLTYNLPFQGRDTGSTLLKIINEPPPPLNRTLTTPYPPELDNILQRALAKTREERYATAEDFAFDLGQVQDQLKRDLISEYLKAAEALVARSELSKAKEQVFQILKVDRQNRRGNELLKQIQSLIQDQQRSERLHELRNEANEAIGGKQYDRALECLDQALSLDSQSAELQSLRDAARKAKQRAERVQDALRRAESAHCAGELDEALAAVDEALEIDADSAEAQSLRGVVVKEKDVRTRQSEINSLLTEAQRQISSRRFTTAIGALQKAAAMDPSAAGVKELLALAESGREQERKRKEIEQLSAEIQEFINHDDYISASAKADEAVSRFPTDNGLLKLQALADRQKQAGEKRQFIEDHVSRARRLLESGQNTQALELLETACHKYPSEPALLSLITVIRENLEQDRVDSRKQEYVQRAKDALKRKKYDEAVGILEAASAELKGQAEIEDLLQFVREEAATQTKRQVLDVAAQEAHRLVSAEQYEDAIAFLQGVLEETSDEELDILLADAQRQLSEYRRRVSEAIATAERLRQTERFAEAVRYLESQASSCGKSPEFAATLERAHREQERAHAVGTTVQGARSAISANDLEKASALVDDCKKQYGETPELTRIADEVTSRRREAATAAVSKAVTEARMMLLARSYDAALEGLEAVAASVELVANDLRSRYENMREEAERGAHRKRPAVSVSATTATLAVDGETVGPTWIASRRAAAGSETTIAPEASTVMETAGPDAETIAGNMTQAPTAAAAAASAAETVASTPEAGRVATGTAAPQTPAKPIPFPAAKPATPKATGASGVKKPTWLIGAAAGLVVLIIAIVGLTHRSTPKLAASPTSTAAATASEGYVEVILEPWGTVKSLAAADGKVINIGEASPVLLHAEQGEYSMTVVGPTGEEQTDKISITANQRVQYQHTFEVVDGAKIVSSY